MQTGYLAAVPYGIMLPAALQVVIIVCAIIIGILWFIRITLSSLLAILILGRQVLDVLAIRRTQGGVTELG